MLNEQMTMSLAMCLDISQLIDSLVREGVMSTELSSDLREKTELRYDSSSPGLNQLKNCCRGAMYTSIEDSMMLHLNPPNDTISIILKRKSRRRNDHEEVNIATQHCWAPFINFIQTEDFRHCGTMLKVTGPYMWVGNSATMILWAMAGVILGCKELYCAIDQKDFPFHHND